ncbi:MAG: HAD family phosphatase [Ruminococcaceae bacterium]|nr:HAD family phosphatase [Oscillospiraceae bacterium]
MRLQSAIFDMDGTLVDSMAVWNDASARLLRARGIEPDPATQEKIMSLTLRQGVDYCRETYGLSETTDELMDMVMAHMEDFYTHHVELKPGVKKFLSLLKMEGVWMYIATNTDRRLVEIALKRTGIDGYFRGILTCAEVGAGKRDSAEVYERCMRRLQSNKKDTVVFEDAIHAIRTAKAAGFRVCAVYDAPAEDKQEEIRAISDYYIRSFEEMFTSEIPD